MAAVGIVLRIFPRCGGPHDPAFVPRQRAERLVGQRGAVLPVRAPAEETRLEPQPEPRMSRRRFQHLHRRSGDLWADAVALHHRESNLILRHRVLLGGKDSTAKSFTAKDTKDGKEDKKLYRKGRKGHKGNSSDSTRA